MSNEEQASGTEEGGFWESSSCLVFSCFIWLMDAGSLALQANGPPKLPKPCFPFTCPPLKTEEWSCFFTWKWICSYCFLGGDRDTPCSPGWTAVHYVGQTGLEFPESHLPRPPQGWNETVCAQAPSPTYSYVKDSSEHRSSSQSRAQHVKGSSSSSTLQHRRDCRQQNRLFKTIQGGIE